MPMPTSIAAVPLSKHLTPQCFLGTKFEGMSYCVLTLRAPKALKSPEVIYFSLTKARSGKSLAIYSRATENS